jgi:hypothetical protein
MGSSQYTQAPVIKTTFESIVFMLWQRGDTLRYPVNQDRLSTYK